MSGSLLDVGAHMCTQACSMFLLPSQRSWSIDKTCCSVNKKNLNKRKTILSIRVKCFITTLNMSFHFDYKSEKIKKNSFKSKLVRKLYFHLIFNLIFSFLYRTQRRRTRFFPFKISLVVIVKHYFS